MQEKIASITQTLTFSSLTLAFLLTPLFFLPLTTSFFTFPKQILFLTLTAIALLSWLTHSIITKTIRITLSPMLLPLFLFTIAVITSTILNSPDQISAWLNRSSLFVGIFIYYLLFTNSIKTSRQVKQIINIFLTIATGTAILGILSYAQAFSQLNLPNYLISQNFTPLGSSITLIIFLIISLPISLILAFKTNAGPKKLLYFLAAGIKLSSAIIIGSQFLPGQDNQAIILPFLSGWSITIDTFKSSILLGSGPGSFLNQFTRFKPIALNNTDLWLTNFTKNSNELFQLLTTLGVIGTGLLTLVITSWFKLIKQQTGTRTTSHQLAINTATIISLIIGLFFPYNIISWITFITLLVLSIGLNKSKNKTKIRDVVVSLNAIAVIDPSEPSPQFQTTPKAQRLFPILLTVPVIIGLIFTIRFFTKASIADAYYKQSIEATQENDGVKVYEFQRKAIEALPNLDRYHIAYANTSLAIASNFSRKETPTDQEKQTISQLVQQAVSQNRIATQLNPRLASNWANLANIYRQILNFAEGADQFAIASYTQAVQLDPANPMLRLDMGSLFFNLEQYEDAIDRFQETVNLKPDYANAYYNLAASYKQLEKPLAAYQALQQVLSLLPADSEDVKKVQEELAELESQLPKPEQETKQTPVEQQLQKPTPPQQAPKDFEPIEVEEPTPSQEPTPTP